MPKQAKTSDLWRRFAECVMDLAKPRSTRQEDVAREISRVGEITVGQTSVSGYKTGERTPSLPVALAMAKYAEMSVEYLYTGKGPKRPWSEVDSQFRKLIEHWEALDDKHRSELLHRAEELFQLQGTQKRRPRWLTPEDPDKPPKRSPH